MGSAQARRTGIGRYWTAFVGALLLVSIFLLLVTSVLSRLSASTTKGTREVLCIGVERNEENTARFDPRVVALCGEVGVSPVPEPSPTPS